jgi:hypothetical protein
MKIDQWQRRKAGQNFFFFDYLLELKGAPTFNIFLYTTTTLKKFGIRLIGIHREAISVVPAYVI